MKLNRLLCAAGALSLAATGCAYQGSSYGHNSWSAPTYSSYGTSYGASYRPAGYGVQHIGATRLELEVGAEEFIDGDIIQAGNAVGPMTTTQTGYSDAFKRGYRVSAGLARDVRPNTTVLARGFYKEAEGETGVPVGTIGAVTVNGQFSDYKSYGAELGLRQYVGAGRSGLRPYLGATVGAEYIDDITLTTAAPIALNEAGWVPTASGTAGIEMPVSRTASLALESGIRWSGSQDRAAAATAAGYTDDGSKLSVPVTLRGSFRF
ncbi:hypothetical protein ACFFUB_08010 [Algimonas porphyrae]|uniref:Autotransporter outer membrane beta-barrel domain-containing protein n=1 Tax=Algimonas porphyrae TaxID=1128113 RepID=A0ABQ5V0C8_9PROT|nr:hypothetical protein [Algimonas porphyrae]GLQ20878.1 hypothetical protein GCM10007854_18330 [Algimonas porphyrae]